MYKRVAAYILIAFEAIAAVLMVIGLVRVFANGLNEILFFGLIALLATNYAFYISKTLRIELNSIGLELLNFVKKT